MGIRVLITGANGFLGSYLVREILARTDWEIVSLERLNPTAKPSKGSRVTCFYHDFRAPLQDDLLSDIGDIDYIVHAGATLTLNPRPDDTTFIQSNVTGTFNMLEAARKLKVTRFVYVSSSEVFGPSTAGTEHGEDDRLNPTNIYAAAKAGGEMLCRAYFKSFHVPAIISRPVNLFGVGQHPSRFISLAIRCLKAQEPLEINSCGSGHHAIAPDITSRQYIHVEDYVDSLLFLLNHGQPGEAYNSCSTPIDNHAIATRIAAQLNTSAKINFIEASPKYNLHLCLSGKKLEKLGWKPMLSFDERFQQTVDSLSCT